MHSKNNVDKYTCCNSIPAGFTPQETVANECGGSLLAANHLFIRDRILFDNIQKSSRFLLEIVTLASANIMGIAKVFIVEGKVIYIGYEKQRP
jgi:hypothetical protein